MAYIHFTRCVWTEGEAVDWLARNGFNTNKRLSEDDEPSFITFAQWKERPGAVYAWLIGAPGVHMKVLADACGLPEKFVPGDGGSPLCDSQGRYRDPDTLTDFDAIALRAKEMYKRAKITLVNNTAPSN